jgi:hypothetical protein
MSSLELKISSAESIDSPGPIGGRNEVLAEIKTLGHRGRRFVSDSDILSVRFEANGLHCSTRR